MAAAQLLGGPQVATPKQIRRIMQVGLTNDQVTSHLQKVRLQNKDPQVPNIEAANQHNAKPANQQAWFQDSWAAEGQSGQS
ncbi:Transcription factor HHO3 [Vitis vinifera]|uniref:Transcription factor HHO3 n=1 Tax=Vitis vinifera TaxID=29760 RepID=A0A438IMT0_VITVI|nr:Transcription factor HHO3 [Vitis vinifera]RVW98019.1 Transcription factor HHO3 [Vitis vinifera]